MERKSLIDNSTLSGVERLVGFSQIKNLNYIDNDILCLEKLITAILFSDKIFSIDDYKEDFRNQRLRRFGFIDFLSLGEEKARSIKAHSVEFAKEMIFSFNGSKPTGDVLVFFDSLRIDPQLRWDVYVSSEYLTLSYLVHDRREKRYETAVDCTFRHEVNDRLQTDGEVSDSGKIGVTGRSEIESIKDLVSAFKSSNPNFVRQDGKSALERMIFGYGWVAERSSFYSSISADIGADLYLAPLRDAFCESCLRIDYPGQVNSLVSNLKAKSQKTLELILEPSGSAKFAAKMPFFRLI